eukprot:1704302-Rhodomonas_salina.1
MVCIGAVELLPTPGTNGGRLPKSTVRCVWYKTQCKTQYKIRISTAVSTRLGAPVLFGNPDRLPSICDSNSTNTNSNSPSNTNTEYWAPGPG